MVTTKFVTTATKPRLGSVRRLLPAPPRPAPSQERSIGIAGVLCLLFSVFSHSLDRIVDYTLTIYGLMVRFVVFYCRPDRIMGFMRQVLTLMSLRRLRPGARCSTSLRWGSPLDRSRRSRDLLRRTPDAHT